MDRPPYVYWGKRGVGFVFYSRQDGRPVKFCASNPQQTIKQTTLAFPLLSPAPPAPKGGSTHLSRSHVVRWARGCAALVPAPSRPSSPRPREARQFRKGLLLFCTSKSSVPRCDSSRVRRLLSNVRWAIQLVAGQRARRTRKAWHGTKPINNEILHRPCFHTNSPR